LQTLGYASDEVEDGNAALMAFSRASYDIVMTDLNMPGADGYMLARCLRGQGVRVPIVAITAHASEQERRQCREAGIDEVLIKPILLERLGRTLQQQLQHAPLPHRDPHRLVDITRGPLPAAVYDALLGSLDASLADIREALVAAC